MGWAVGWDRDHRRWRGYGVPAYCDAYAKGCRTEIDRGMGWVCDCIEIHLDEDPADVELFVCGEHTCSDVDENNLPPEHPEWVEHLLTDESWAKWREENPDAVRELQYGGGDE